MEFIHSVLAQNESVTQATVIPYDLPVNPLSHILITIKQQQSEANLPVHHGNIRGTIAKIEVLYKGSGIFSMSGCDAIDMATLLLGFEQWGVNNDGNNDDWRTITYLVPFGRKLYWPTECYPASTRGELILQITYATTFSGFDNHAAQIETIELPAAAPERYLRMTTLSVTPTATGEHDVDLPIGHPISDLILYGTSVPAAAVDTPSITYVQILVDNIRRFYSHANFDTLQNMAGLYCQPPTSLGYHVHRLTGGSYAQYADTSHVIPADHTCKQRLRIPFDINMDGEFILETAGKSSVICRVYAGVADAMRVIPCELVAAAGGV